LWEEIVSKDLFFNLGTYYESLNLGSEFAKKMGDSESEQKYKKAANDVLEKFPAHYNGHYIFESTNREKDSAVIHAIVSFYPYSYFKPSSKEVADTVNILNNVFCH